MTWPPPLQPGRLYRPLLLSRFQAATLGVRVPSNPSPCSGLHQKGEPVIMSQAVWHTLGVGWVLTHRPSCSVHARRLASELPLLPHFTPRPSASGRFSPLACLCRLEHGASCLQASVGTTAALCYRALGCSHSASSTCSASFLGHPSEGRAEDSPGAHGRRQSSHHPLWLPLLDSWLPSQRRGSG